MVGAHTFLTWVGRPTRPVNVPPDRVSRPSLHWTMLKRKDFRPASMGASFYCSSAAPPYSARVSLGVPKKI